MLIKYRNHKSHSDLPIRWLFANYYRVYDEQLFFLKAIEHGIVFEKVDPASYEMVIYQDLERRVNAMNAE